jgi:hypothetical protein
MRHQRTTLIRVSLCWGHKTLPPTPSTPLQALLFLLSSLSTSIPTTTTAYTSRLNLFKSSAERRSQEYPPPVARTIRHSGSSIACPPRDGRRGSQRKRARPSSGHLQISREETRACLQRVAHARSSSPTADRGNEREEREFQIINGRAGAETLILICVRRCTGGARCRCRWWGRWNGRLGFGFGFGFQEESGEGPAAPGPVPAIARVAKKVTEQGGADEGDWCRHRRRRRRQRRES